MADHAAPWHVPLTICSQDGGDRAYDGLHGSDLVRCEVVDGRR